MASRTPYRLSLSLNALNHLGLNLYSNTAAVLAETVANAWDADAENVWITIDQSNGTITIRDDGHGMDVAAANAKFLTVGYARRDHGEALTPKWKRPVMGRKGIGKLSLFSIAKNIEVHTAQNGVKHGFMMSLPEIQRSITAKGGKSYEPPSINQSKIKITSGTQIILSDLSKNLSQVAGGLRKRMARRFAVLGAKYHFAVHIDGQEITIGDRDYFHKLQYVWRYGAEPVELPALATKLEHTELRLEIVSQAPHYTISGWIGSVAKAGDLDDLGENINKIVVLMRGKVAIEDILEVFNEGGVYSKYLIGEISADFLDIDTELDIATSSRQKVIEDDARFLALKSFIAKELKHIQSKWTELRNKEGEDAARSSPEVDAWFRTLSASHKEMAGRLFGKLNQLPLDDDVDARKMLFKQSIIAFQSLSARDRLKNLDQLSANEIQSVARVLGDLDDLDSARYYQVIKERLDVIRELSKRVGQNALEKVIQKHLFKHLWLLDPSWERATDALPEMEKSVMRALANAAKLSRAEKAGRFDIKYKVSAGAHIIIELKRPDRVCSVGELLTQITKYGSALRKCLVQAGEENPHIEIVCIVGKDLREWTDQMSDRVQTASILQSVHARVIQYPELISRAEKAYAAYLQNNASDSALSKLIESVDTGAMFGPGAKPKARKPPVGKKPAAQKKAIIKSRSKKKKLVLRINQR